MTKLVDAPITWRHCKINGNLTSSCDAGKRRLYVCERFGAVEAWVDQVKIGNFATMGQAKTACLNRIGVQK